VAKGVDERLFCLWHKAEAVELAMKRLVVIGLGRFSLQLWPWNYKSLKLRVFRVHKNKWRACAGRGIPFM
jgi:hypothetical protein